MRTTACVMTALFLTTAIPVCAAGETPSRSPYAGQEKREIKTLSPEDIDELRLGKGWGLAKAAELNGIPGPVHLLEMADEIGLTRKQRDDIEALYEKMREEAVPLGLQLIESERALNRAFAEGSMTEEELLVLLSSCAETRRDLRFVHLATHLRARPLLTDEQVTLYNRLRGYSEEASSGEVPAGHDPEMWRRHNSGR